MVVRELQSFQVSKSSTWHIYDKPLPYVLHGRLCAVCCLCYLHYTLPCVLIKINRMCAVEHRCGTDFTFDCCHMHLSQTLLRSPPAEAHGQWARGTLAEPPPALLCPGCLPVQLPAAHAFSSTCNQLRVVLCHEGGWYEHNMGVYRL